MKKTNLFIIKYMVPCLLIVIYFIPFICVKLPDVNNDSVYYDTYFSPFKLLFNMNIYSIISIIFLLINISYFVFCVLKLNNKKVFIKRVLLISSIIFYILIFKFSTNSNLNLLSTLINVFVALIYILNLIKEIFYYELLILIK